ncbi:MAG TPA: hypothetical protein VN922_22745 [Bacteroidia bacterium]|nr:hypothetical protein [Bacteroidia bacterium]
MNKVTALLIYYKQIFAATLLCSVLACTTIYSYGWWVFTVLFWFKVITTLLALYLNNVFRGKEIYFYYNLGVSKKLLFGSVLILDTALFILLLVLFFQPK